MLASSLVAAAVVCDAKGPTVLAQQKLKRRKPPPIIAEETQGTRVHFNSVVRCTVAVLVCKHAETSVLIRLSDGVALPHIQVMHL